jgi:hypothetical protein
LQNQGNEVTVDLLQGKNEILANVSHAVKKNFQKGKKTGMVFYEDIDGSDISQVYSIFIETMKRREATDFYFFTREFLESLIKSSERVARLYIVKLDEYRELGCPIIGQPENVKHTQLEPLRSEECLYNDHEVAAWIKPGTAEHEYDMKLHGWNILSTALANNKTVIDLGADIRENKKYFYYEFDHVFLRMAGDLYLNQFFCNNFYASWNSDQFKESIPFEGPVEQYITVGIGVYWVIYLERLGTTPDTKVIFTDINYNTLQFMKAMVEDWDGNDYADFYQKHLPIMPNGINRDINAYVEYTKTEWESFISKHPNWLDTWNKIKLLKFDYVLIDYMSTYDLGWVEPGRRTLINLSDVFTHGPYISTQSLKYRISCENKLLNTLRNIDPNINVIMTSRSANNYYPKQQTFNGPVSNFDLTDINLLKKAPWHKADWASPRMLG